MKQGDPEPIRDSKKSSDLIKWAHNNGAGNPSVVIMYSTVDAIINAFSFSMRPFDPERSILVIVSSLVQ